MGNRSDDLGRQAVQISNALTRNHREHFGRGAGSVKTVINKGFVVTFLEEIYTPLEQTLIDGGRQDLVHEATAGLPADDARDVRRDRGRGHRAQGAGIPFAEPHRPRPRRRDLRARERAGRDLRHGVDGQVGRENRRSPDQYQRPRTKPPNATRPTRAIRIPSQRLHTTATTIPAMTRMPPRRCRRACSLMCLPSLLLRVVGYRSCRFPVLRPGKLPAPRRRQATGSQPELPVSSCGAPTGFDSGEPRCLR